MHLCKSTVLVLFILLTNSNYLIGQFPVGDCLGAIPVCDPIYFENDSPEGAGFFDNEINPDNCVEEEEHSVWYIFTVQNTGDFGFILTPNDLDDDYDWSLFNLTGKSCADIISTPSMTVSCNAAGKAGCQGVTGCDGSTPYNMQNQNCGQNPPVEDAFSALNALVPVQEGETYALMIINWTESENGYTLDFTQSAEVGIFDILDPEVAELDLPTTCGTSEIPVTFSENITCATFENTSVSIDGPGGPYAATISSVTCDLGGTFSSNYTISVSPPFNFSGDYSISFDNSPLDLCDNNLVPLTQTFTISPESIGTTTFVDTVDCEIPTYTIDATATGTNSYLWNDGTMDPVRTVSESGDYIVEINSNCELETEIYSITFLDRPSIANYTLIPDACQQNLGSISNIQVQGIPPFSYSLDNVSFQVSPQFEDLAAGTYTLYVMDPSGCIFSEEFIIDDSTLDMGIELQDEIEIVFLETVNLDAVIIGDNVSYFYWEGDTTTLSCLDCLNPIASPLVTSTYTLVVFDALGCEISQSITVRVVLPRDIYIPNIFTPNNDGVNDYFTIFSGKHLSNISELAIYSRWGEKVFHETDLAPNDQQAGWDGRFKGRTVNAGVFVYVARLTFIDNVETEFRGTITVIR